MSGGDDVTDNTTGSDTTDAGTSAETELNSLRDRVAAWKCRIVELPPVHFMGKDYVSRDAVLNIISGRTHPDRGS